MKNKIISLLTVLMLLFTPIHVYADEPEIPAKAVITGLRVGDKAPYDGVLLNDVAAAKLLTDKKYLEEQWQIRMDYEVEKERARLMLTIETQKVSYDSMVKYYEEIEKIKDKELQKLYETKTEHTDYSLLWAAGGILVGIGLTVGVVYIIKAGE